MLTLIFFIIHVENIVKLMTKIIFLINANIIILAVIIKNRTRPFRAELFNIVTGSNLNLNNIIILFLSCTRHILNAQ